MNDRRVQIGVAVALVAVVGFNVVRLAGRDRGRPAVIEPGAAVVAGGEAQESSLWAAGDRTSGEWMRNPFSPAEALASSWPSGSPAVGGGTTGTRPSPGAGAVEISGVGRSEAGFFALVGDSILRVGDRLGAGTITEITDVSVKIGYRNGTRTINVE